MIRFKEVAPKQKEKQVTQETIKKYSVVIFNDDIHTFEYVIDTLIEVCGHEPLQAEQCTMLIHYKGKCSVKSGEYAKLLPIANELIKKGLTVEIQ